MTTTDTTTAEPPAPGHRARAGEKPPSRSRLRCIAISIAPCAPARRTGTSSRWPRSRTWSTRTRRRGACSPTSPSAVARAKTSRSARSPSACAHPESFVVFLVRAYIANYVAALQVEASEREETESAS